MSWDNADMSPPLYRFVAGQACTAVTSFTARGGCPVTSFRSVTGYADPGVSIWRRGQATGVMFTPFLGGSMSARNGQLQNRRRAQPGVRASTARLVVSTVIVAFFAAGIGAG